MCPAPVIITTELFISAVLESKSFRVGVLFIEESSTVKYATLTNKASTPCNRRRSWATMQKLLELKLFCSN
jgi:hypothetical protein